MYRCKHSALLHLCQYVFPHIKPPWQPPNHFHLLLRVSGMHCWIICHPSQFFLFLEELSNIIYSCLLTLTVVQNRVWSNQLNVYHFLIQCQLLPSLSPWIPCRPSESVPSERLRLVKRFHFAQAAYWRMGKSCVIYLLTHVIKHFGEGVRSPNRSRVWSARELRMKPESKVQPENERGEVWGGAG